MSGTEETSIYTNGYTNGNINGNINGHSVDDHNLHNSNMNGDSDIDSFLFTSESVGEGHPGMNHMNNTSLNSICLFI